MSVDISITVRCAQCGFELEASQSTKLSRDVVIDVDPCEKCIELAREEERG